MLNKKKYTNFLEKIKECLSVSLSDYNIIFDSDSITVSENDVLLKFKCDKLQELYIRFSFKENSVLLLYIHGPYNSFSEDSECIDIFKKKQREEICVYLINLIKSYFEKQYEDTVTNIPESEHTDTEVININKDVAIKYLKTIEAIYAILEQIKLENTNYKLYNLQHNMEKNSFTGELIFSDNIGNNLSLIIKYENNIINISYNDYKNELKTLTFDITYLTLRLMLTISHKLNVVIKKEFINKQIELGSKKQDALDIISDIFVESDINETLFKILKEQPNFRKMKTEIILYKRELQKTDFGNPFQEQSRLFIDTVKGKVDVLTFNIIKEDGVIDTLCEILLYKNNNQLLIKVVGGYIREYEIQYTYLYDLNKEQDIVKRGIEQMLVHILLTYINKYNRNIKLKPFNTVNEKSDYDGDHQHPHILNKEENNLNEVSKNVISLDFTSVEDFDFTDEQKDEVMSKIIKKASSIIKKKIKKFKSKNERIEKSKIPSEFEIATDPDFNNVVAQTTTHLSTIELDPLSYLVKQLVNNLGTKEIFVNSNYVSLTSSGIIDERYKGNIEIRYFIYGDIDGKIMNVNLIEYFVLINGKVLYNRIIDTYLLRDYRNFIELILK